MGITDTDVAAGGLGYAVADAIIQFNKVNVFWPLVEKKKVMKGAIYGRFPVYTRLASSNVTANAAGSEGADTNATDITSTAVDIEVLRYSARADITDLVVDGNDDNVFGNAGQILGNAISAKFDKVVGNDMTGSAVTTLSNPASPLTVDIWMEAIQKLHTENIPGPYNAVLTPKQVWGPYGLSNQLLASGSAIGTLGMPGQDMINNGYAGNVAGVNVYYTPELTEQGSGSYGVMFGQGAQGVAYKDMAGNGSFIVGETERNAAGALTKLVANGYFSTDQLNASASVLLFTQTSA